MSKKPKRSAQRGDEAASVAEGDETVRAEASADAVASEDVAARASDENDSSESDSSESDSSESDSERSDSDRDEPASEDGDSSEAEASATSDEEAHQAADEAARDAEENKANDSEESDSEESDEADDEDAEAKPAARSEKKKSKSKPAKEGPNAKRRAAAGKLTGDITIRAVRLSKWYGKVTAVSDVSLQLGPGIWGLLGPNGSGKTSFMRMAAGQLKPSLGKLLVCGEEPFGNPNVLHQVGYCPEADSLYDELTGFEFVTAMAELSGYPRDIAKRRAADALEEFGLADAMNRRMGGYSRGMRQRAKLAQAIAHDPKVLLLDEPLTGTDPTSRHTILESLRRRAAEGALVLFSTHVLHEIEALTDQLLLIARGQVVAQGGMHEIRELLDEHPHHIQVRCDRPRDLAAALLANERGIVALQFPSKDMLEVRTWQPEETYRAIARQVLKEGISLHSMISPDATLEALFHYLVERANQGAGSGADAGAGRGRELKSAAVEAAYNQQLKPGASRGSKRKGA